MDRDGHNLAKRNNHVALQEEGVRPLREMLFGFISLALMGVAAMPLFGTIRKLADSAVAQQLLAYIF